MALDELGGITCTILKYWQSKIFISQFRLSTYTLAIKKKPSQILGFFNYNLLK